MPMIGYCNSDKCKKKICEIHKNMTSNFSKCIDHCQYCASKKKIKIKSEWYKIHFNKNNNLQLIL